MMRRSPMKPTAATMTLDSSGRFETREVTKLLAGYPPSINAPLHALGRYHWNEDL